MDIQSFINKFQLALETDYLEIINKSEDKVVSKNNFDVNYCNERTLAYFSEKFIEKNLEDFGVTHDFLLNEYFIKLSNSVLTSFPDFSNEIEGVEDEKKTIYIPDSCLSINNETYYLEYKVCESSFSYIKLARDYLKYKYYTHNSAVTTYFIYINFTKEKKGAVIVPTIRFNKTADPKYQIIGDKIKSSDIDENARVFIAKSERNTETALRPSTGLIETLDEIIENSEPFFGPDGDEKFASTSLIETNLFYQSKGVLGSNVILSNFIKSHINLVDDLYKYFEKHISDYLGSDFKKDKFEVKDFEDAGFYFKMIIRNLTQDEKNNINEATYNVSYKRSYWIIYLLKKFCENNGINIFDQFSLSNEKIQKDYESLVSKIDFFHRNDDSREFTYLCYKITFLIHNLYDLLFRKGDDGQLYLREEVTSSRQKSKIINCFERIKTDLGYRKRETITFDNANEIKKIILSTLEVALSK